MEVIPMKAKIGFITLLILVVGGSIFNYTSKEREELKTETVLTDYAIVANKYRLGTYVQSKEIPVEIELYPSKYTQVIIDRWKDVASVSEMMEYPTELIGENEWMEADKLLTDNLNYYIEIERSNEVDEDDHISSEAIRQFIFHNEMSDNLQKAFDQAGVD